MVFCLVTCVDGSEENRLYTLYIHHIMRPYYYMSMHRQDCMLHTFASSNDYFQKTQTNCSTWTLTKTGKTERRKFSTTINLILFHRHTVKHQIIFLCHILRNNTNAFRWIITSLETSDSTSYNMWDRYNRWEVCLAEHTEARFLYHHFKSGTISGTFRNWKTQ